jgi:hypothetical protein
MGGKFCWFWYYCYAANVKKMVVNLLCYGCLQLNGDTYVLIMLAIKIARGWH